MKIIIEDKLKRHMEAENLKGLVVDLEECIACGGGYKRPTAKFLDDLNKPVPKLDEPRVAYHQENHVTTYNAPVIHHHHHHYHETNIHNEEYNFTLNPFKIVSGLFNKIF